MATGIPQHVQGAVNAVDRVFQEAQAARRLEAARYGGSLPGMAAQALTQEWEPRVNEAAKAVTVALDAAQQDAQARRDLAVYEDATGEHGVRYLLALPGLAAVFANLTPDQIALRMTQAQAAGLIGDLRAMLELVSGRFPVLPPKLVTVVQAAEVAATSRGVTEADQAQAALEAIAMRWHIARHSLRKRLADVVENGTDAMASGYTGPFIAGESASPNTSIRVS